MTNNPAPFTREQINSIAVGRTLIAAGIPMTITTDTITAPAYWASYLVNGDDSSMTSDEVALADARFEGWTVLSIVEDSERFTNCYDLYGDDRYSGGDVCDYIVTPWTA